VDDRAALDGILYVLQTGIPWEELPQELGFGSGMTCWRRLRDLQAAGVWEQLHLALLRRLREHDQIDWERASIDGASVSSPRGARKPAATRQTGGSSGRNGTSS
jgi:transposase